MSATTGRKRILVIGWDAADWRVITPLLEAGKMPALESLINRGVMGNLATIRPVLSPILWTSIATGKRAFKHGIHGFAEPTPDGGGIQPISNLSRKVKAFWNIFNQSGMSGHVVGWWPSNPAEPIRGSMVSNLFQMVASLDPKDPWPVRNGSVHPKRLTQTLADLRFHPSEINEQQIRPFIPHAEEVDQETDGRMGICAKMLSECTTVHSVATHLADTEPWDYMAVYYDAIDHFCHGFMKYHPPRQPHVSEEDFRLYSNVVEAGYRYHDMMLATWLSKVGPETTVVLLSDHGFHPDHMRLQQIPSEPAAPAAEHRDFGVLVAAGPGVKQDERVYGANLLDICPTLLAAAGLPIANDMDGVPLLQIWRDPPRVEHIESWEDVPGDTGQHPQETKLDPRESQEAIEQLVDLGYIEKPDSDVDTAIRQVLRELRFNLAQAYMDADRHTDAVEILRELRAEAPDDNRFVLRLALCYQALDQIDELEPLVNQMVEASVAKSWKATQELVELARVIKQREHDAEATDNAEMTEGVEADLLSLEADLKAQAGVDAADAGEEGRQEPPVETLQLKDVIPKATEDEKQKIHKLLAAARHNPYSFDYFKGYVHLAKGQIESALECFRRAERAEPDRPWLPIQIGEALLQLKQWGDAERSFRRALECDSENAYAFAGLARSYLGRRMNQEAADMALRAVGLLHHYAFAHYLLGIALFRLGKGDRAIQALELAVAINPNFAEAHRRLAQIARHVKKDHEKAEKHRRLARRGYDSNSRNRPNVLPKPIVGIAQTADAVTGGDGASTPAIESRLSLRPNIDPSNFVTVVSGLPRSGTSMLMQMLAAGGVPALSDGEREADDSNPRGYFELESVKRLQKDASCLTDAQGKAVKVIAQLLPYLPQMNFRLIYVDRDLDEVVRSQRQMLQREGRERGRLSDEQLKHTYSKQIAAMGRLLKRTRLPVLRISHRQCIEDPAVVAGEINRFLGGRLDTESMARVVDRRLYRQRSDAVCVN